jgi:LDH2 family malate/lactate/ureidoglycolate dehydrogenase
MPRCSVEELQDIAPWIFQGADASADKARLVSRYLINASFMDHHSHG